MCEFSHTEISNIISRLIREEKIGDDELQKTANHILYCQQCLEELLTTLQIVKGELYMPSKWFDSGLACLLCRGYIPRYVEETETNAQKKYPWVSEHLLKCPECREEEETLRLLVNSQEEIGPMPFANTEIKELSGRGEPVVFRFTRMVKVLWEGKKSFITELPGKTLLAGKKVTFSPFHAQSLLPAYLGPDDSEGQEITYSFPEGLNLSLTVIPVNQHFTLSVTPRLSGATGVYLKLYGLEENDINLIADAQRQEGQTYGFTGLRKGIYEVHVETSLGGLVKKWEIPFQIG